MAAFDKVIGRNRYLAVEDLAPTRFQVPTAAPDRLVDCLGVKVGKLNLKIVGTPFPVRVLDCVVIDEIKQIQATQGHFAGPGGRIAAVSLAGPSTAVNLDTSADGLEGAVPDLCQ